MITTDEDLGVQVGDCSMLFRYSNDAHFRAVVDAETQMQRDRMNAVIDAGIARARAARAGSAA